MKGNLSGDSSRTGRKRGDIVHTDPLNYATTHGRDTGCEVAPECLRCPLAKCKHDMTAGERWEMGIGNGIGHSLPLETREQIKDMVRSDRLSVQRIADIMQVSTRTVQRLRSEVYDEVVGRR
jgi:hypothetical protein